ncbi:hypothetical protein FRC09_005723 [Ceratobasidium sp. 395]|nr:hypothetical protein FRC09_005723 [Ceratobasidium sp. 395]
MGESVPVAACELGLVWLTKHTLYSDNIYLQSPRLFNASLSQMPAKRKSAFADKGSSSKKRRTPTIDPSDPSKPFPVPDPNAPYPAHLPDKKLTIEHKEWLVQHQPGYNEALGPKGGTDGGSRFVRETVLGDFLTEFFPDVPPGDREDFLPYIYKSVNTRLNNESKKKSAHLSMPKESSSGAVNTWFHDNQDEITEEFNEKCKSEGKNFHVNNLRSYYCAKYKDTTEAVQLAYTQRHADEKAILKAKVVPEDKRPTFATQLTRKISVMVRDAEEKASVWFEGTLGYVSGGVLELKRQVDFIA